MTKTSPLSASALDDLYTERGEWLDSQAARTMQLDKDGYYRNPDPNISAKITDLTEQIEIVEHLQWLAGFDLPADDWLAEAEAQARDEADEKATQASALGTLY